MAQTADPAVAATAARRRWRSRAAPRSRDVDFAALHAAFIVTAVTTVLVIRTQLWLTHYPQLGGHGLHIAHLLYGGALMTLAIGLGLTFVGSRTRRLTAVVGGIGFGFFIDELGKFITADNNYFFKPAAALIYALFIGLYLGARALRRRTGLAAQDYVASALDLLADTARRPLDAVRRERILTLLGRAGGSDPFVSGLVDAVSRLPVTPAPPPSAVARIAASVRDRGGRLLSQPRFPAVLVGAIAVWAIVSAASVIELVFGISLGLGRGHPLRGFVSDALSDLKPINVLSLVSTSVTLLLVAAGLGQLRRGDRAAAYRRLEQALLVAVLLTRVFSFVEDQFHAVLGLAVDLILLTALEALVAREAQT